jgi:hypothetical protein
MPLNKDSSLCCSHCYAWRCHPDDRFCGHCGENLLQAEVIIEPVSAIYQDSEVPNEFIVKIRNLRGGLGGTRFFWRNQAGTEVNIVDLNQDDLNQKDQQESYKTLSIDLAIDPAVQEKWSLIHWVADNKEYTRAILSCGLIQPSLTIENKEILLQDSQPSSFPYPISVTLRHETGGSALLENIEVSASEGIEQILPKFPRDSFPVELSEGKTLDLTLPITNQEFWNVLKGKPQGFELTLALQIKDLPYYPQLPLTLRIPTPARLLMNLPEELRALEGRSLRLPISIENTGGETCKLSAIQVDILKGEELIHSFEMRDSYTLDAGKTYRKIIYIPLVNDENQALTQDLYHCKVQQFVVEERLNISSITKLKIEAVANYRGIVTIDFGTTATAVAILPLGNNQSPISLPLSEQDKFIPTAIAYFLDENKNLQYRIGHDAIALLDDTSISNLVYLDNLKWRLDDKEPVLLPDGTTKIWEDIAVDYLNQIKNIVEEYTDVVAIVERVVITQPSRFHPLLIRALNSTYRKAGFKPLPVQLGDNSSHKFVAESWPSLTTSLPLRHLQNFQNDTVGVQVFGENCIGKHAVLTYDVGGGSTDMSLFLINIENYAKMQITELGTDGTGLDDKFFGNGFSDLLFKSLWSSCESWLKRQGYDPQQFPITLPWQPLRADDKIGRENGRRCANFVLEHLQGQEGPFNNIHLSLQNIGGWDDKENEELNNLMTEFQEAFDASLAETTLSLKSLYGTEITIPAGTQGNGIFLDFAAFINEFIDTCSAPMFERLKRLVNHDEISELEKIYLITTGRGAFFPLVRSMLWAHQERLKNTSQNENQRLEPVRVEHDFAKTIVSQGACYLARLSREAGEIVFVPRSLPSLGIQGSPDPDTGKLQFIPLCSGLPTPADGWQLAAYPLRRLNGEQEVTVTLYLSADNKNFITDNDKWLAEISEFVEIKSELAHLAHIMVKAEFEDCLEIYLGFPPEADTQGDDYDQWEKYLLGEYELVPGARENQKRLTQIAESESNGESEI